MHLNSNELTLLCNKGNKRDKKTISYSYTITDKINKQELGSVKVSSTLFQIFVDKLNVNSKRLINKADRYYQANIRGKDFNVAEWFIFFIQRSKFIKALIAMFHNKALVCNTPRDILKLL